MTERPSRRPHALVGRLYDDHGASLYRYALMLLADVGAAEDAIQQVFAALLKPGAAQPDRALHYLRRAVRNECYSMLRRRKTTRLGWPEGQHSPGWAEGVRNSHGARPLLETVHPNAPSTEDRLALEGAIRELPPEQREVVHLHIFEGLTFQEVADAAGESIHTVAGRYRYALAKLRQTLTR